MLGDGFYPKSKPFGVLAATYIVVSIFRVYLLTGTKMSKSLAVCVMEHLNICTYLQSQMNTQRELFFKNPKLLGSADKLGRKM